MIGLTTRFVARMTNECQAEHGHEFPQRRSCAKKLPDLTDVASVEPLARNDWPRQNITAILLKCPADLHYELVEIFWRRLPQPRQA
jgi:hypothetical protein